MKRFAAAREESDTSQSQQSVRAAELKRTGKTEERLDHQCHRILPIRVGGKKTDGSPEPLHQPGENKEKGGGGADERRRAESRQKINWRDVKSRRTRSSVMESRADVRRGLREEGNNTTSLNHLAVFPFRGQICERLAGN